MENSPLKTLMDMMDARPEIAARVEEIGYDNLEELAAYACTLGLTISVVELAQQRNALLTSNRELADADIDDVAGGFLFHVWCEAHNRKNCTICASL